MKNLVMLVGLMGCVATQNLWAQADFSMLRFEGKETVNGRLTGKSCLVVVGQIVPIADSFECFKLEMKIGSPTLGVLKGLSLSSQETGRHLQAAEGRRVCASWANGSTLSEEIFSAKISDYYTRYYSGMQKQGWFTQKDFFLKVSPETYLPTEAAVNTITAFSEQLVECIDLN